MGTQNEYLENHKKSSIYIHVSLKCCNNRFIINKLLTILAKEQITSLAVNHGEREKTGYNEMATRMRLNFIGNFDS
jgi:hypothetical protein